MISHELKCIFIHIPGTGGSSIEKALIKKDWWEVDSCTKHIPWFIAKEKYKNYWGDYFKFSWIREPIKRFKSLCRFPYVYFPEFSDSKIISLNDHVIWSYMNQFWNSKSHYMLEMDPRFYSKSQRDNYINSLYSKSNYAGVYEAYLGDELDFIGTLENIESDFQKIRKILNIQNLNGYDLPSRKNEPKATHHVKPRDNQQGLKILSTLFKDDTKKYKMRYSINCTN